MRPSVSRLLSWQPAALAQAGQTLLRRAGDLQRSAADLSSIGSGLSGVWSGAAAQAATAHHTRRSAEVDELATVVHTAGQALVRAADAIAQARSSLRSALAAASAAGCTVLDDGTVLPPARPPVPAGLPDEALTAWQTEADATAAAQAAGAARLERQISAALTVAGAADDVSAAALRALQPPQVSPAPQPVSMGLTGGQWAPIALPSCPTTPPARAPAAEEDDGGFWGDLGHGVLDVAGLVPVLGEPADGVNALWYEAEGDHVNAALSAAGMLPVLGMGATAAKVGIKGAKAADDAADAAKAADESAAAARQLGPNATGGRRIPNDELQGVPTRRGDVPVGNDGHPVELHHRGQTMDSPLDEMTRSEHRGAGNFRDNHPYRGPSQIDRKEFKRVRRDYWSEQWDEGRFGGP